MIVNSPDGKHHFEMGDRYFKIFNGLGKRTVEEDSERWVLFIGDTGSGKSLKQMHTAYVMNGRKMLRLKNICFDKTEFIKAILEADHGDVIMADEAISIAFNRASMTKDGRIVAEIANQIRQKNLVVCLCVPDPLNLDFVILNKINAIVSISEMKQRINKKNVTFKGCARVYVKMGNKLNQVQHLINYLKLKKQYTKDRVRIPIPQPFCMEHGKPIGPTYAKPWYPIDPADGGEAAYREKKESVLKKYLPPSEEENKKNPLDDMERAVYIMHESMMMSFVKIGEILNKPPSTVRDMHHRYKNKMFPPEKPFMPPKKEETACDNAVVLHKPPL